MLNSAASRKYVISSDLQKQIFVKFLYPLQNTSLTLSAYATIILALERQRAVTKPVEYHLMVNTISSQWLRVWASMGPAIIFCIIFNVPKIFELEVVDIMVGDNNSSELEKAIHPTRLRLSESYVFYYVHLARLFVTGIIPFIALVYLNSSIHR